MFSSTDGEALGVAAEELLGLRVRRGRSRASTTDTTSRRRRHTPLLPSPRWPPRRSHTRRPASPCSTTASSGSTARWPTTSPSSTRRASASAGASEEMDDADAGPDPLPDARAARHAVRAQLVPLPRPLPDLRRARVVPAPRRLVQRVLDALRAGDRRLLRARAEDVRTQVGKPGAYSFEPVDPTSSPSDARGAAARSTSRVRDVRAARRGRASRASLRARCCRSAPTPSSTGRSTRARS